MSGGWGSVFRQAYEVCADACTEDGVLDRPSLREAMVLYVEKEHSELIRQQTHAMVEREAETYIKRRHHASRPSASSIEAAILVATGAQAPLPPFESVLNEMYDLPNGSSIALGNMSVEQLRDIVEMRQRQLAQDRAILGRLELLLGEAERRNVQTVRELLAV